MNPNITKSVKTYICMTQKKECFIYRSFDEKNRKIPSHEYLTGYTSKNIFTMVSLMSDVCGQIPISSTELVFATSAIAL